MNCWRRPLAHARGSVTARNGAATVTERLFPARNGAATVRERFFPAAALACCLLLATSGCGYHVAGKGDTLPKTLRTIAIPAFTNLTVRYKLADRLPEALAQEFIARTRYQVVPDERDADMVLHGVVVNFISFPIIFDQASGRATAMQVNVTMGITLTERATGKVLYSRPNFDMRQRYEISIDPQKYFEESDTALGRLAHDTARQVVSAVLENF